MTAHVANILDRLFSHVPNFKVAKSTVQYMAPSSSRSRCPGNSWWSCIATFRCSFSPVRILLNRDFPLYLQEKFPGLHTTSQRFSGTITGKIPRSPYYFTEIFWYNYRKKFPGLYTPKLRFSVRITVIKSAIQKQFLFRKVWFLHCSTSLEKLLALLDFSVWWLFNYLNIMKANFFSDLNIVKSVKLTQNINVRYCLKVQKCWCFNALVFDVFQCYRFSVIFH